MTIIVPHKTCDLVAFLNAHRAEGPSNLIGALPSGFQRLAVGAAWHQGDHLFIGVKLGTAAENSRHQELGSRHGHDWALLFLSFIYAHFYKHYVFTNISFTHSYRTSQRVDVEVVNIGQDKC